MRASRLVNLLLLLQTRGRMTAGELARELEVSVRTIYRDVDELSAAGVPIYAERGPHGGVRLVEGYRTRLTGLTAEEAEALFLSGLPGPAAELGLGTVVAAARLKVLAAMPPELRARASRITERFLVDVPGWFRTAEEVPHLAALTTAVWESRRLRMVYRRPDKVVERTVEPLGVVLKGGAWYLVALTEGGFRTYRAARVLEATITAETFERPVGFDLASHWASATADYERDFPRIEVTLRVDAEAVDAAVDLLGEAVVEADPSADSSALVRGRFEWDDDALVVALRLGSRAEVVEPTWLRERVLRAAVGIVDRYRIVEDPAPARSAT